MIPPLEFTIDHGTVNADSLLASPQIRICQGTCTTTTTIASIVDIETGAIPSFMTLDSGVLTVDPRDNALIGKYELRVTMTTVDSGDQVFDTVVVDVDYCVITHIQEPDMPLDLDYKIFAVDDTIIDISVPGFQQVPACGYYLVETITWTIPSDAPIV